MPEQPTRPSGSPGLEPPDVESSGSMENPQPDDSGPSGPEGFPADSGVPDSGVMNSEGADNDTPPKRPRTRADLDADLKAKGFGEPTTSKVRLGVRLLSS